MGKITRRSFLTSAAAAAGLLSLEPYSFADTLKNISKGKKPNIIVILADDLGYGDLQSFGCKDVPTPNIDSIGKNGVKFTDAYVTCPVCCPSRAGLLTGRYQTRFGWEFNSIGKEVGLPVGEKTIADNLKAVGYRTAAIGKWHLGDLPQFRPNKRGFDEFYGFLGGATFYLDRDRPVRPKTLDAAFKQPIYRNDEPVTESEYLTDAFARESVAFIERSKDKPFFLYAAFNAVHMPTEASEKYVKRFEGKLTGERLIYAAMISALDDAVGNILNALRKNNLEQDSIVIFTSDNGGDSRTSNKPLRGQKNDLLEGGIRIPMLMQWKGHLKPKTLCDKPVISLDIMPTALAAAGMGSKDPLWDGTNLLDFVAYDKKPERSLYWRYDKEWAIRNGDYKIYSFDGKSELYNLRKDIAEQNDLSKNEPKKFAELKAQYDTWNAKNVPSLWKNAFPKTPKK